MDLESCTLVWSSRRWEGQGWGGECTPPEGPCVHPLLALTSRGHPSWSKPSVVSNCSQDMIAQHCRSAQMKGRQGQALEVLW